MYSDFFHEKMYIVDDPVLTIPVRKESQEGLFDLEIISCYGVMKAHLPVMVIRPVSLLPRPRKIPLQPVARAAPSPDDHDGDPLIMYSTWLYTNIELLNIASFITLIIGALYTWYRQQ